MHNAKQHEEAVSSKMTQADLDGTSLFKSVETIA